LRSDSAVSASIGPYGAILHDGSEYSGNYVDDQENLSKIEKYFVDKVNLIKGFQPDIFAFETVPALKEIEIIHEVMKNKSFEYYVSVQAKEDDNGDLVMGHGESLTQFIDVTLNAKNTENTNCFALGLNCIHSKSIPTKFVKLYLKYLSENPNLEKIPSIVLYPNNNMIWCGETHTWTKESEKDLSWAMDVISVIKESDVYKSGRLSANGNDFKLYLGGCCGYSPDLIRALKESVPEMF
jgi:homocysteine S-methyltransferase